jgi:hypothetical protein
VKEFSSGKPAGAPARAVMAVPGLRDQVLEKRTKIRGNRALGFRLSAFGSRCAKAESQVLNGFRGRNPIPKEAHMYTGTLIADLMKTVEQVTSSSEQQMKEELHEIFTMQIPVGDGDQVYQGAA